MQSYTTISVKPTTKQKIRLLKGSNTYSEFLDDLVDEEWDKSEYDETDIENEINDN